MDTGDARLIGKVLRRTVGGVKAVSSTDAWEGTTRRLNQGEEATREQSVQVYGPRALQR